MSWTICSRYTPRSGWRGRTPVAPHVRRDAPPAFVRERLDLRAPHQADLRPAMDKDHQRPIGGPGFPVSSCVTRRSKSLTYQEQAFLSLARLHLGEYPSARGVSKWNRYVHSHRSGQRALPPLERFGPGQGENTMRRGVETCVPTCSRPDFRSTVTGDLHRGLNYSQFLRQSTVSYRFSSSTNLSSSVEARPRVGGTSRFMRHPVATHRS